MYLCICASMHPCIYVSMSLCIYVSYVVLFVCALRLRIYFKVKRPSEEYATSDLFETSACADRLACRWGLRHCVVPNLPSLWIGVRRGPYCSWEARGLPGWPCASVTVVWVQLLDWHQCLWLGGEGQPHAVAPSNLARLWGKVSSSSGALPLRLVGICASSPCALH